MNQQELQNVLDDHKKWLINSNNGCRADLSDADLRVADLGGANLGGADLSDADLRVANLGGADLRDADLRGADLSDVNLRVADLRDADLRVANLSGADLGGANLCDANLRGANLGGANLSGIHINEGTAFFTLQCPEEGSFIGWKKCQNDVLVKLFIPVDAKRSSATSLKCRASKAIVEEVFGADYGVSIHDSNFIYRKGDCVEVKDFDENRWNECSSGIHFFLSQEMATQYM